jgi:hypothetical protein
MVLNAYKHIACVVITQVFKLNSGDTYRYHCFLRLIFGCQTELLTTLKWARPMQLTCIAHWIFWNVCHSFRAFPLPSKSMFVSLRKNPGWNEHEDWTFPKLVYFYWLYMAHTFLKQTVPLAWKINFIVIFSTCVAGCWEWSDEPRGPIKSGEFLG